MRNNNSGVKKIGLHIFLILVLVVVLSFSSAAASDEFEKNLENFPESYRPYLIELHGKYPNWVFEAFDTGLDFNETVKAQYGELSLVDNSVSAPVFKSHDKDDYNVDTGSYIYKDGGFVQASEFAVSYFLDPRNFLDEESIFQFERLDFNEIFSIQAIELILKNSFMYNTEISYLDSSGKKITTDLKYSQAIYNAGKANNINPCYLASKILNEVGNDGSYSVWGNHSTYPGIYNFYNIGATDGTNAITRGLAWANGGADGSLKTYGRPWNTPEKSIMGGAQFLASSYISVGQFTGYLQRFNVNPDGSYKVNTHQFMTNLTGAFSQGYTNYASYAQLGIINNGFVFSIPVYRNMPETEEGASFNAVDTTVQYGSVNVSGLTVRSGPSTLHSKVLTSSGRSISLPQGTQVKIISKHFTDAQYYSRILQYPLWYYVSFTYNSEQYYGYVFYDYIDIITSTNVGVGRYDISFFSDEPDMISGAVIDNPYVCKVVDNDTVEFLKPGKVTVSFYNSTGLIERVFFNVNDSIGNYKITDMDVISDSSSITVTLGKLFGAERYGYYLVDKNGKFVSSAEVSANTYTFKNLSEGSDYSVYCRYIKSYGYDNGPVRCVSVTTPVNSSPEAPYNLKTDNVSTKGYSLSWDCGNADGYRVYRLIPEEKRYIVVGDVFRNDVKFDDLDSGYACAYRIKSFRYDSGKRIYSDYSELFWAITAPVKPSAPVAGKMTCNSIPLSWSAAADADKYEVYLENGNNDLLVYDGKDLSCTFNGAKGLTQYSFYIVAKAEERGAVSVSEPSASLRVITPAETVKGFKVSSVTKDSYTLSWDKIDLASYYRVYSVSDGLYTQVASTEDAFCTLTGLENSKKTTYVVTASYFIADYVLESDFSEEFTATTLPDAVTGLKGTPYENKISLKWNKVKNADCYNVYLKENGKYVLKKTVSTNSYVLGGLEDVSDYSVRVRAYIRSTLGTQKGKIATYNFTTMAKSVTGIKASSVTDKTCTLSWNPSSDGVNRYNIYRYDSSKGDYVRIAYTKGATSVTLKNLTPGSVEKLCIIAYIMDGSTIVARSYKSDAIEVITKLSKVSSLKGSNSSAGVVDLSWAKTANASYYRVYMYDSAKSEYVLLGSPKTTSYKVTGLTKGKSYKFKIRAIGKSDGVAFYGYYSSVLTVAVKK